MTQRYYWLRLKKDFFTDKRIKKLRKIAGGDTYTIIYLKMQLLSLQDEGMLYFENIEDTFEEEIALQIDEDVEDVRITINFLLHSGLLVQNDNDIYELIETKQCIGSETDVAQRVRKSREKQKMLQCNTDVTKCNIEIDNSNSNSNIYNIKENIKRKNFVKPTIEEIEKYCEERKNGINANTFYDFYESKNWYVGKNKMKDWKACIRTWEQRSNKNKTLEKNIPSWFNNQTIKKEEASQEELDTLQKMLKNY